MIILDLIDEDIVNYKKTSMFIATSMCDWKCCKEGGFPVTVCQNHELVKSHIFEIDNNEIVERYLENPLTSAIVFGGLEPMLQFEDMISLINDFRQKTDDDIVIYTGYYEHELEYKLEKLRDFKNIIIKFGRYKPNQEPHFDEVLGVNLANDEQYAKRIS